jgi:hypothetical protein
MEIEKTFVLIAFLFQPIADPDGKLVTGFLNDQIKQVINYQPGQDQQNARESFAHKDLSDLRAVASPKPVESRSFADIFQEPKGYLSNTGTSHSNSTPNPASA